MVDIISGLLTISISSVGAYIAFKHAIFYKDGDSSLGKKLRYVFFTDGLIYLITLLFGGWVFLNLPTNAAYALHWARHPILLANILASINLYRHYKLIGNK